MLRYNLILTMTCYFVLYFVLTLSLGLCTAKSIVTEAPELPDDFEDQTKTQTKLPDSELRMSMGILYQSEGRLLHGLNRYNLVVGIKLPEIDFKLNVDRPSNDINNLHKPLQTP